MRDQLKFNVKHGRHNLLFAVQMLLIFSLLSFFWEFTKVLTWLGLGSRLGLGLGLTLALTLT